MKTLFCFQGLLQLPFQPDGTSAICPALQSAEDHALRHTAEFIQVGTSVADPDANPDPSDPYVFGPPGSGSFYHQAIIVRKALIQNSYYFVTSF